MKILHRVPSVYRDGEPLPADIQGSRLVQIGTTGNDSESADLVIEYVPKASAVINASLGSILAIVCVRGFLRHCWRLCQSVMPTKKLSIKSRRLQNPSRFLVRNFSNPRSCSSSYARPKSASQRDLSQRTSNPSSSAEKFFSCFFARSTVLLGFGYGNYRAVLPAVVRSNRETGLSGASTRWRPERTQRDDEC